jgi:hypothetical protein
MKSLGRRSFLSLVSQSFVVSALLPVTRSPILATAESPNNHYKADGASCWLDVCAPLLVQDQPAGVESDIVLTSDNFIGAKGHSDGADATEYEIYLYDAQGKPVGNDGVARRLTVPAMHTTVIPLGDLVGPAANFWGGMRVRLRPKTRKPSHASDLFSSAFVRWRTKHSFANVHANPDPLQWQRPDSFFYSMPFPPLRHYECVYSIFNPYAERSAGSLIIFDPFGAKLRELPFDLAPHSSVLLNLRTGDFTQNAEDLFTHVAKSRSSHAKQQLGSTGGTIGIVNRKGSVKNFGYLLMKQVNEPRFSVEHPIHQPPFDPLPSTAAFDSVGRLIAKNVLYTPLVFHNRQIGGVTLKSRFHLSSGAPMEQTLRMRPFITDEKGGVAWQIGEGTNYPASIPESQIEKGVIKLGPHQSCIFDCSQIGLPRGFSGGFSLAVAPTTNHTLMKVEILVNEWNAAAFTHFRPGLAAARAYQKPPSRAGLATDYIASGARVERRPGMPLRDEVIAIINVDDKSVAGNPSLEIFSSEGFLTSIKLGDIPAFGCRHYLLSELVSGKIGPHDLSLRLIDAHATLLMSIVHLDHDRRDIALDHGSDRFSTFSEFTCDAKA